MPGNELRQAIFLDRDGVINHPPRSGLYITAPEDVRLIDGVREAIVRFREEGYLVIVVTNQSGIARGVMTVERLEAVHDQLRVLLAREGAYLDDILYCPHDDADGCICRKPQPGMLIDAAVRHDIDLSRSLMVGDAVRDVQAGIAAGCRTVFIDSTGGRESPAQFHVDHLSELTESHIASLFQT